jgi:hypothetical protein
MKYSLLICLLLSACTVPDMSKLNAERGKMRQELFVKCMEQSAKITRHADDDVSDIVQACSDHAYYTSNQIIQ